MAIIAHFSYKCKLLIVLIIGYMHLNFLVTLIYIFLIAGSPKPPVILMHIRMS